MVNARKKGIRYELETIKKYKKVGYLEAKSSRLASKLTDDKGVDIVEVWNYLPQCKNYQKNYSVGQTMELIKGIRKNFKEWIPIIHVKLTEKRRAVVITEENIFFELLDQIQQEKKKADKYKNQMIKYKKKLEKDL